ncbi:hypothetical protein HN51_063373 [Arachis hypogaea]
MGPESLQKGGLPLGVQDLAVLLGYQRRFIATAKLIGPPTSHLVNMNQNCQKYASEVACGYVLQIPACVASWPMNTFQKKRLIAL